MATCSHETFCARGRRKGEGWSGRGGVGRPLRNVVGDGKSVEVRTVGCRSRPVRVWQEGSVDGGAHTAGRVRVGSWRYVARDGSSETSRMTTHFAQNVLYEWSAKWIEGSRGLANAKPDGSYDHGGSEAYRRDRK